MNKNLVLVAMLTLMSCGNSTQQKYEIDSLTINCTDSTQVDTEIVGNIDGKDFTSYDLACFELKGHVKKIVTHENEFNTTYEFDRKGKLIKVYDDYTDDYKIGVGPEGELVIESEDNVTRTYYALDNACMEDGIYRLIMMWGTDGGESYTAEYKYDDSGKLIKIITSISSPDDEEPSVTENGVKVVKVDKYGNWIARVVGNYGYTTTRDIEFYK